MGGAGTLVIADTGGEDGGDSISTDCRQAYNYFGARGQTKLVNLMRPILSITGAAEVAVGVDTDYGATATLSYQQISGVSGDPWGGVWSAAWAQASAVYRSWFGVAGEGFALAPRLRTITDGVDVTWSATDVVYEWGGRL
jgi:hypothetical protein